MNRATRNNSGPVASAKHHSLHVRAGAGHKQSRDGIWAAPSERWSPGSRSTFGLRQANLRRRPRRAPNPKPRVKRTEFEVAATTADACLTLAASQETVRAAQAGVDRAQTVLTTTAALVNAQLRPGADQSRAEAELAAARTQMIQAQQAVGVARATVAQFVGAAPADIELAAPRLLELPPAPRPRRSMLPPIPGPGAECGHRSSKAQLAALGRAYFPAICPPGRRVCARHRRGNQRQRCWAASTAWLPACRTMAWVYGNVPGAGSSGHPGARGGAGGHRARRNRALPADRGRPARRNGTARWPRSRARARWPPILRCRWRPRAPPPQQATARYQSGLGEYRRSGRSAAAAHPS